MKTRRHHNNDGLTQIKRGRTVEEIRAMAKRLGISYRAASYRPSAEPSQEGLEVAGNAATNAEQERQTP